VREIIFYRTQSGHCPVEEFLDALSGKQAAKVTWVLRLVEELEAVPKQYFKKIVATEDIWEVRVKVGRDIFRLLGFFDSPSIIVLNHAFTKKTRKISRSDISLAEQRKRDYFTRRRRP
jgi:phage-related protein